LAVFNFLEEEKQKVSKKLKMKKEHSSPSSSHLKVNSKSRATSGSKMR